MKQRRIARTFYVQGGVGTKRIAQAGQGVAKRAQTGIEAEELGIGGWSEVVVVLVGYERTSLGRVIDRKPDMVLPQNRRATQLALDTLGDRAAHGHPAHPPIQKKQKQATHHSYTDKRDPAKVALFPLP